MFLDLSANNTKRKAYEYELVETREKFKVARGAERIKLRTRMRTIRAKIRQLSTSRDYGDRKVGITDDKKLIIKNKKTGAMCVIDRMYESRHAKNGERRTPFVHNWSRALTYEEHQELLRQQREKKNI